MASGWTFSLFASCNPVETCCKAHYLYGRAHERLRNPELHNYDGTNEECKSCFNKSFWIAPCIGCHQIYHTRLLIREKYGIEGSNGKDCATSYFCSCCALKQHDSEIAHRNEKGTENVDKTGYKPQPNAMIMPE
ncbi:unnamed protein product [Clonostachys rhizophaga]|uniref:Uncharacterized protein n=1 Tax=Clonostachys rhizophaga TaxID=160324 RepID=A0A9N9YSC9_9HYPO|nr:unnamed protein product [Clonostachys rhizophaga]